MDGYVHHRYGGKTKEMAISVFLFTTEYFLGQLWVSRPTWAIHCCAANEKSNALAAASDSHYSQIIFPGAARIISRSSSIYTWKIQF